MLSRVSSRQSDTRPVEFVAKKKELILLDFNLCQLFLHKYLLMLVVQFNLSWICGCLLVYSLESNHEAIFKIVVQGPVI